MPWERPTLKQLYERISQDFSGRLLDGAALPQRSVLAVMAKVWAGAAHTMHGFLEWLYKQVFVDTAEGAHLARWAAAWGLSRKVASKATGRAIFSGTVGARIPQGTICLHKNSGQKFAVQENVEFTSASAVLALVALEAGIACNLPVSAPLSLTSPIAGVQSTGAVHTEGISGGYDEEADACLLTRLLSRLRQPPRGGAKHDYEAWALEVPGVTRAWCYPLGMGIGTVSLTFVTDNAPQESGGAIPTEEMVRRVQEHIEPLRPASVVDFVVFAPDALELAIRLSITQDTPEVREAVRGELFDLISRVGRPDTTILISHIHEAISLAHGEFDHVLYEPKANVEVPAGYFPILKNVIFA